MLMKLLGNKIFQYLFFRYTSFGLQLLNSLLIAFLLGPGIFANWAFILLVVQYFNQLNFGIPQALNNVLSISKEDVIVCETAFQKSFTGILILNLLTIIFFGVQYFGWIQLGNEFDFGEFLWLVCFWVITNQILILLINVNRIYGQLKEINLYQLMPQVSIFIFLLIWRTEISITKILWVWLTSNIVSIVLLWRVIPLRLGRNGDLRFNDLLGRKGLLLFVYNSSFYLIVVIVRSLSSSNFTSVDFAYMSFAFTCANSVILLIDSFSFIAFPKLLGKFSKMSEVQLQRSLEQLRLEYSTIVGGLAFVFISVYAFGIQLSQEYRDTLLMFILFLGSQIVLSRSFGISIVLMAKGREAQLAVIAFLSLVVGSMATWIFICYLDFLISWSISGIYVAYITFAIGLQILYGDMHQSKRNIIRILVSLFSFRLFSPLILAVILAVLKVDPIFLSAPLLLFCLLNIRGSILVWKRLKMLMNSPGVIDL
jgi:hypothetical protein